MIQMFDINILFPLGIVSQCGATDGFLITVTWKVSDYNSCPSRAGRGALTATHGVLWAASEPHAHKRRGQAPGCPWMAAELQVGKWMCTGEHKMANIVNLT